MRSSWARMTARSPCGSSRRADVPTDGSDLPAAPEIVLALAKRLIKDPDFQDDVLDWYYEHQDNGEARG